MGTFIGQLNTKYIQGAQTLDSTQATINDSKTLDFGYNGTQGNGCAIYSTQDLTQNQYSLVKEELN